MFVTAFQSEEHVRKVTLLLSLIVMLCGGMPLVQAQPAEVDSPLLISGRYGEGSSAQYVLYQDVNQGWKPLPIGDFYRARLSPGGEHLAVLTEPPFLQTVDGGQDVLSHTSSDIALVDLKDLARRNIAIQPESITLDADSSGYSGGIKRSLPVWSPDGSAFAWTEQDYPAQNHARLVVYDLESDTSRVLDDALPQLTASADGLTDLFNWGVGGIVVFTNDPSDNAGTLRFYDAPTGLQQAARVLYDEPGWLPIVGPLWLTDGQGKTRAVVQASDTLWYWIDPATGEVTPGARLELASANNPDDSLRLVWNILYMFPEAPEPAWQLVSAEGTALLVWEEPLHMAERTSLSDFVIAPSGQAAAYLQDGVLYVWQDGQVTELTLPQDFRVTMLYWGPVHWRAGAPYEFDALG